MSSRFVMGGLCGCVLMGLGTLALRGLEPTHAPSGAPPAELEPHAAFPGPAEEGPAGFLGVVLPEATVDLASRLEGRLASVRRQVGDTVKQGEVLAVLEGEALRKDIRIAEAQLQSARAETRIAELSMAEAEEKRKRLEQTRLVGLGAVSQEEVATVRYAHQVASAREEAARARAGEAQARVERLQQELTEVELRAPFSGVIASRFVDPGALVKPGQVLFHLLRSGVQRVRFAVPESQTRRLAVGQAVRIVLQAEGLSLPGHVSHVSPEVDAAARVALCLAELDQASDSLLLSSGAVVRVLPVAEQTAQRSLP